MSDAVPSSTLSGLTGVALAARRALAPSARLVRGALQTGATLLAPRPKRGTVRVFYGFERLPSRSEVASGGIVKFQALQDALPNSTASYNVLYLGSSSLPSKWRRLLKVAHLKGARVVWNQNGVAYPGWHGPGWEQVNAPMAEMLQAADHVFYQSGFCKQSADRFLGQPRGEWEVLYNPVDTSVFTPSGTDPESGGLVLLLGGSQYAYYRLETALRVLERVARRKSNARMLVTGRLSWSPDEADNAQSARRLAGELGVTDRVTFIGPYSQVDAPGILHRAHVLIHTKYNDPCPTAVIEAMACGLPVVYSHSGGVPELVGEDAGIGVRAEQSWERVEPPDPDEMAEAVLRVAERRGHFAEAARRRAVERFDVRAWVQRHLQVFQRLVS